MANVEKLIPFIIKYETGTLPRSGETAKSFFERSRRRGYANDPLDKGGATQTGVTIAAYKAYCNRHRISAPTVANLQAIPYETWLSILKEDYWDRWQADRITNQSIANILVDWVWASGKYGITKPQALLGVKVDGIVGAKTLACLNSKSPLPLFAQIKNERIKFVNNIVKTNPSQKKWLNGWTRRINDIKFEY